MELKRAFKIKSSSHPGKYHIVKWWKDGRWTCDDFGWRFQKGSKRDCKHIVQAKRLVSIRGMNRVGVGYKDRERDKSHRFASKKKKPRTVMTRKGKLRSKRNMGHSKRNQRITKRNVVSAAPTQPKVDEEKAHEFTSRQSIHLTARMAWHDNKWNGTICKHPDQNIFCVGNHSLLSDRLQREKNVGMEVQNLGAKLDSLANYLPPCYWSSNAFSPLPTNITHTHPFRTLRQKKIEETMGVNSIFTWPFRLAFNHSDAKKNAFGSYNPKLPEDIKSFFSKFRTDGSSLVFFYLNYDNSVSAEDFKYALVGCARISEICDTTFFSFGETELKYWTSLPDMQNFPTINWATQIRYDFARTGVRLPYHEYLEYLQDHPDEEDKLNDIKVLVDEADLVFRFKYVAEELNEDQCLFLLYKLKKALAKASPEGNGHGIVDVSQDQTRIETYLKEAWARRGLFPGLSCVVDLLADPDSEEADPRVEELVTLIRTNIRDPSEVREKTFELILGKKPIPRYLWDYRDLINRARDEFKNHPAILPCLETLCLFSLTKFQISRIVFPQSGENGDSTGHPFGGKDIKISQIASNPYILCEQYIPITSDPELGRKKLRDLKDKELDRVELRDGPITPFTIDIGMFPDSRYLMERVGPLHHLTASSPERLRALTLEFLNDQKIKGQCFTPLSSVHDYLLNHPLFYKRQLSVNKEDLISPDHLRHFSERLHVTPLDEYGEAYFYLNEVFEAERIIERVIQSLVARERKDHRVDESWVLPYVRSECNLLGPKGIVNFNPDNFKRERTKLLEDAIRRSFYIITGKPGSGKTFVLEPIIKKLQSAGESVTVVALTGKAVLRVKQETHFEDAQTLDMLINSSGAGSSLRDLRKLHSLQRKPEAPRVQNLIIDEASMIDEARLAILLRLLELQGLDTVKRIIMVGDPNQLPPIGLGKPFVDIISFTRRQKELGENHFIRLETNCRQKLDQKILEIADIFVSRNRYYSDSLAGLIRGGKISPGLTVEYWDNKSMLSKLVENHVQSVMDDLKIDSTKNKAERFNLLLGLHPGGWVKNNSASTLEVDNLQILTPYRGSYFGASGINDDIREIYKMNYWPDSTPKFYRSLFGHSEKVIRTENWYYYGKNGLTLLLSNGSIGVICNQKDHYNNDKLTRFGYFPDAKWRIFWDEDEEENFDPAYAITVHKSQGSEFENVFVVIPERRSLLTKELMYTALTRSKGPVVLLVQKTPRANPLEIAQQRSAILRVNSSLFSKPVDYRRILEPDPGVRVDSMAEYVIYEALKREQRDGKLRFVSHQPKKMMINNTEVEFHPDFTVYTNDGKIHYWEHLGMLDLRDYSQSWLGRRQAYQDNGLIDSLITTDDLNGLYGGKLKIVLSDIESGTLKQSTSIPYSNHHYLLYEA